MTQHSRLSKFVLPSTAPQDFFFKRYLFDGKSVGCTLWDTAGQESFRSITASYYRGSQGAVFGEPKKKRPGFRHCMATSTLYNTPLPATTKAARQLNRLPHSCNKALAG